jgi:hypothetical protein
MTLTPEQIAEMIAEGIEMAVKPIVAEVVVLKKLVKQQSLEIADFKLRRGLKFCGVWREDERYSQHDVVACKGAMWVAVVAETRGRPGDCRDWLLCVKQGQPGRDGRGGHNPRGTIDAERERLS